MNTTRPVFAAALATLLAVGCGSHISTSLAHPARVGQVQEHALVRHDRNGEGTGFGARMTAAARETSTRRLPPGALDDAVRLVRFDQTGVCFDLLSRHTEPSTIDFRSGIDATLIRQPDGVTSTVAPIIAASAPRGYTEVAETDVSVRDGWSSGCEDGECWSHATYRNETRNVRARVYESRALFCFPNDGSFNPATQAVELSLPHGRFRWEFDTPASAWARPVITMQSAYVAPTNRLLRAGPPPARASLPRRLGDRG